MKKETEIQSWIYINALRILQEHNGTLAVVQNGTAQCSEHRSLQYCTAHERQNNSWDCFNWHVYISHTRTVLLYSAVYIHNATPPPAQEIVQPNFYRQHPTQAASSFNVAAAAALTHYANYKLHFHYAQPLNALFYISSCQSPPPHINCQWWIHHPLHSCKCKANTQFLPWYIVYTALQ